MRSLFVLLMSICTVDAFMPSTTTTTTTTPTFVRPTIGFVQQQQQQQRQRQPHQRHLNMLAIDSAAIDTFYQTQPYLAAFLTCSVKSSAADLVVQTKKHVQEKCGFDVPRNLAFICYGGLWQGLFQEFLFTQLYPLLFGTDASLQSVAMQVLFDTTISGPILCLPVAYSIKSIFASGEWSIESIQKGLEKYWNDINTKGLLQTYWSIWIPAQIITFGFVPAHFRVVFVAAISFFWVTRLSAISSSSSPPLPSMNQDNMPEDLALQSYMMEKMKSFDPMPSVYSSTNSKNF